MSNFQQTPGCTTKGRPMSSYVARDERVRVVRFIPRTVTIFNGSRAAFDIFRSGGGDVRSTDQVVIWNRQDPAKKMFKVDQALTPFDSIFRNPLNDVTRGNLVVEALKNKPVTVELYFDDTPYKFQGFVEGDGEDPDGGEPFEVDRIRFMDDLLSEVASEVIDRTALGYKFVAHEVFGNEVREIKMLDNGAMCGGPASDCTTPAPAGHVAEIVPEPINPASCVPAPETPKPKKVKKIAGNVPTLPKSAEKKLLKQPSDKEADANEGGTVFNRKRASAPKRKQ